MRGFVCANAHPVGCARTVDEAIAKVQHWNLAGPKRVLVVGSSGGLGFAARTVAAFGCGAQTVGVCLERPGRDVRTATAGWYRTARFHQRAEELALGAWTVNGDAFGDPVKRETIGLIRRELGQVDLVVYSVAAPRRTHPVTGEVFTSALKTLGAPFSEKGYDRATDRLDTMTLEVASDDDVAQTVAVMGGEDWSAWLDALLAADVLAPSAQTVAFSYIGVPWMAPAYRGGTLGKAKDHLEATARELDARLSALGGRARVSVMKTLVTQASVVIPMSVLYMMLLYRVMAEQGLDEAPIDQAARLFRDGLYGAVPPLDPEGRLRFDDRELRPEVQDEITRRWAAVTSENLDVLGDKARVLTDVMRVYGFGVEGVAYDADVDPVWPIPNALTV